MPLILIYDTETTGCPGLKDLTYNKHRIIQLAIRCKQTDQTFQTLVRPTDKFGKQLHIPESSTQCHGITDQDVAEEKEWDEVFRLMFRFVRSQCSLTGSESVVWIAHNNHGFDEIIFRLECSRLRRSIPKDWTFFDSLPWLRSVYPERVKNHARYTLSALHEDLLGKPLLGAHDAMNDVNGLYDVMKHSGAFDGLVDWSKPEGVGFDHHFTPSMDQGLTEINGVGPTYAKMISPHLATPNIGGLIDFVYTFPERLRMEQFELYLRQCGMKREKAILNLLIFVGLYFTEKVQDRIALQVKITENFPYCRQTDETFHRIFQPFTIMKLRNCQIYSILDLGMLSLFTSKESFHKFLTDTIACSKLERIRFMTTWKQFI